MSTSFQEVSRWINPQHLQESILQNYRQSFQNHPASLLIIPDFLAEAQAARIARFASQEVVYSPTYGLYSAPKHVVDEAQWQAAEESDRFYTYGLLDHVPDQNKISPNFITYARFLNALGQPPFQAFFKAVTGLPLGPLHATNVHSAGQGDYLRAHDDNDDKRLLTFVLYLSTEWQPVYGGSLKLHFGDQTAQVEPAYNSLVLFDVRQHDYHVVMPIEASAGTWKRISLVGWYQKNRSESA